MTQPLNICLKCQYVICDKNQIDLFLAEDMDNYLQYVGGLAGATALTSIAAASAYYYASRPIPDEPLVPLHKQSPILEVSHLCFYFIERSDKDFLNLITYIL